MTTPINYSILRLVTNKYSFSTIKKFFQKTSKSC
nr:MAG TPA: hypothetical protein [Caudoviricetes sp.]